MIDLIRGSLIWQLDIVERARAWDEFEVFAYVTTYKLHLKFELFFECFLPRLKFIFDYIQLDKTFHVGSQTTWPL